MHVYIYEYLFETYCVLHTATIAWKLNRKFDISKITWRHLKLIIVVKYVAYSDFIMLPSHNFLLPTFEVMFVAFKCFVFRKGQESWRTPGLFFPIYWDIINNIKNDWQPYKHSECHLDDQLVDGSGIPAKYRLFSQSKWSPSFP